MPESPDQTTDRARAGVVPTSDTAADQELQGSGLVLTGITKAYGQTSVLRDVDLHVPDGEIHALLGPSGSGKTTLLKVIAGFVRADAGRVYLQGADLTAIPPEERDVGVVFQNYALFPHMSVFDNVAFGLRMRRVRRAEIRKRVAEVLDLVRLNGLDARRPAELSGGQQQRVAVARALVIRPAALLLDEPLSALDRKVRQEVREELKRIQAETGVTTVFVTHDQEEALFLAHRVAVLEGGNTRQNDRPTRVYSQPADEFVAGFVGSVNLLAASVDDADAEPMAVVSIGGHQVRCRLEGESSDRAGEEPGARWMVGIRPEALTLSRGEGQPAGQVPGVVSAIDFGGPTAAITVDVSGQALSVLVLSPMVTGDDGLEVGDAVWVSLPERVSLLARQDAR